MEYVQIEENINLIRDLESKAILNKNQKEVREYEAQRRKLNEVNIMKDEISNIKSEIEEIKSLLLKLLEK